MPMDQEYPNNLGKIESVPWDTLEELGKFSQAALNELYLRIAKWDYTQRCLAGVYLYSNWLALFTAFAGTHEDYNWAIPEKTKTYIPTFKNHPKGIHPFMLRFMRSKRKLAADPTYYFLVE